MRPIIQRHKSQYKRYYPFRKYGLLFVILDNTAHTLYLRRAACLDGRIAALRFAQRSVKYLEEALAGQGRIQPMRCPVCIAAYAGIDRVPAKYACKVELVDLILIVDRDLPLQIAHQIDDHQRMQLGKGYLQIEILKHHHKTRIILFLYGQRLLHHIAGLVGKAFPAALLLYG